MIAGLGEPRRAGCCSSARRLQMSSVTTKRTPRPLAVALMGHRRDAAYSSAVPALAYQETGYERSGDITEYRSEFVGSHGRGVGNKDDVLILDWEFLSQQVRFAVPQIKTDKRSAKPCSSFRRLSADRAHVRRSWARNGKEGRPPGGPDRRVTLADPAKRLAQREPRGVEWNFGVSPGRYEHAEGLRCPYDCQHITGLRINVLGRVRNELPKRYRRGDSAARKPGQKSHAAGP